MTCCGRCKRSSHPTKLVSKRRRRQTFGVRIVVLLRNFLEISSDRKCVICWLIVATPGSIPLQLSTLPFLDYQRVFSELAPGCGQIGLDELFPTQRAAFVAEKDRVGDLVVAHNNRLMARQFSKTGCPVSLRPQVPNLSS